MSKTYLGFDFGAKNIGVAVGQELTRTATALVTLRAVNNKPDWDAIKRLIEEWRPDACVVGLPLKMDGTEMEFTPRARRFANQLNGRFNLPVHLMDERLSSVEAERIMLQSGSKDWSDSDRIAAQLILQSWLEQRPAE